MPANDETLGPRLGRSTAQNARGHSRRHSSISFACVLWLWETHSSRHLRPHGQPAVLRMLPLEAEVSVPVLRARREVDFVVLGQQVSNTANSIMASHCDAKCRRCSCQRRSCQRRRAEKRRQVWRLTHRPQLLLGPTSGALFQYWRRQYPVVDKEPPFKADAENEPSLQADEVEIDSEDLRAMRDSVDNMQQLLQRGLRDIQEIRNLVKQAAARRESERQDTSVPRATMETSN